MNLNDESLKEEHVTGYTMFSKYWNKGTKTDNRLNEKILVR